MSVTLSTIRPTCLYSEYPPKLPTYDWFGTDNLWIYWDYADPHSTS
jgi:hypothetical protein